MRSGQSGKNCLLVVSWRALAVQYSAEPQCARLVLLTNSCTRWCIKYTFLPNQYIGTRASRRIISFAAMITSRPIMVHRTPHPAASVDRDSHTTCELRTPSNRRK
ncbi:hypothetical protein JB92DRAFT_2273698 [Gautieria morchelliformis]|nr:hypothetical protein JB92DRAFT_2273698 [Gautieria morchelliformis]